MKITILGAGPTGLGAAHHLHNLEYKNWQLYERNSHVGGLAASFTDPEGFVWDVGGHVLFSHYEYFDRVVNQALDNSFYEHIRESWIRILKRWVPYPFQNNIRYLPSFALEECLDGLRNLQGNPKTAQNFFEWMKAVFGDGIAKYFMEPYNRKVWGIPLDLLSKDWIGERVSVIDLARIEKNIAESKDDVGWGPNSTFRFPKYGGTGKIFQQIAKTFTKFIQFDHKMERVDLDKKEIHFADRGKTTYDALITTIPLDLFIDKCIQVPDEVKGSAENLVHNSGLIVGLGFEGQRIDSKCWMYFPENNSPFYRVTNFFNYSPYNVPDGDTKKYFSLMCETTYSSYKSINKVTIIEDTVTGLENSGMIHADEARHIVSRYLIDIPYAYPAPTLERDQALNVILPFLESKNVFSRGRFGAWKYEVGNMDHSFMQGVEVVDRILNGKREKTINGIV